MKWNLHEVQRIKEPLNQEADITKHQIKVSKGKPQKC